MGQMAQDALNYAAATEDLLDNYVNGDMSLEEAFENGFIDPSGKETEGVQAGWDRASISTSQELDNELSHVLKDFALLEKIKI